MRFNKRAQSLLEYVTIITFVMVGIVLGGEYAMRAMSGGIANLTRSEETSRKELIRQGPTDPGIQIPGCDCTDWSPPVCGGGACNQRQMYTSRTCVGTGCSTNFEFQCTYDSNCCSDPTLVVPSPDGCGAHSAPPCTTNYGEGWACWQCGNLPIQCGCKPFNECRFRCGFDVRTHVQNNPVQHALVCPLDDQNIFHNDLPWTLDGSSPSACSNPAGSNPKCQTYCRAGTVKQGNTCIPCNRPTIVAHHDCHCKSNSRCHCVCNHTPINVDAICPLGTFAETGFCLWYNVGQGDAGIQWGVAHSYINGAGESVWRCPGMQAEYHGQSTCRATGVVSIAFCQPRAPCYRSAIVDMVYHYPQDPRSGCDELPNPPWYQGTKKYKVHSAFWNLHKCVLVDEFLPISASPTCTATTVMGDAFYIGYGRPGRVNWPNPQMNSTPYNQTVAPNRNSFNHWGLGCATPPCCSNNTYQTSPHVWRRTLPRVYGCCPAGWKIEGWTDWIGTVNNNGENLMHCLRNEPNFCSPVGSCPAGSRPQLVIEDAYMIFDPASRAPNWGCPSTSCANGYDTWACIADPDQMRRCRKMTTICVAI